MKTAEKDAEKSSADEPKENAFDDGNEYEELEHERDSRLRSYKNPLYGCLYSFVTAVSFNFFIFVLILGNTVTLAAYTYDQSDR